MTFNVCGMKLWSFGRQERETWIDMVGVDLYVNFVLKAVLVVMYDNSKGACWACIEGSFSCNV